MARHRWATADSDRAPDRLDRILKASGSSVPGAAWDPADEPAASPHIFGSDSRWGEDVPEPGGADGPSRRAPRRRWVAARRAALVAVGCALTIGLWAFLSVDRSEEEVIPVAASAEEQSETGGAEGENPAGDAAEPRTIPPQPHGEESAKRPSDGEGGTVVVHVAGAVQQPGIVEAPAGSRIFEVLESAGGALPEAELSAVNLAAVVQDGQQIIVPRQGEAAPQPGTEQSASGGGSSQGSALVNLNTAGAQELEELPRVGPVLAERIVQWRTEHGAFSRPEDIDAIPGIGPTMLESLLPLVTV